MMTTDCPDALRADAESHVYNDQVVCQPPNVEANLRTFFLPTPPSYKKRPAEWNQDESKQNNKPKITNDSKSEKAKKKEEAEKKG
eukprot:11590366-Ditylum_brightwellii.AAC.1